MFTPRRSTARARPRASLAGWIRAQWGLNAPPTTSATASRARYFCGAQLPLILGAQAPPAILSDGRPQPRQLGGRGADSQGAAQVEVGVDALLDHRP